eukprot:2299054-Pleurochrysis_carterae.AAC.2
MNGADALTIHKARDLIVENTVTFTEGETAKENVRIGEETDEIRVREPYPTLYPGEVTGETETNRGNGRGRPNMGQLTDRARNTKHRQERRNETQREKKMRLAKRENGTRVISNVPEKKIGGGSGKCRQEKRTPRQGDYWDDKMGEGHTECSKTTRWS